MSKIDELIYELCPYGVEYIPLTEVINYEQPGQYIVNSTKYDESYKIPVLTAGQTFILGYTDEKDGIYAASKENPVIIFDDFTGAFKWVDFPFKVKSSVIKILFPNTDQVALRYIFHIMGYINFKSDEHKRLWISTYSLFKIPFPPISVQNEIVRILDNFTELTAELTAELTTELTSRKHQYEHYKEKIIDFSTNNVALGETIISLNTGLNPRRFFVLNTQDAKNYYVTIREIQNKQIIFTDRTDRINDDALILCNNRSNLEAGDVLFSGTGTIGEVTFLEKTPLNWNIKEGVYAIKPNPKVLNGKYLMHLLCTAPIRETFLRKSVGGTVKSIPMAEMRKLIIPLPSLEKQKQIVDILDSLDDKYNVLFNGLSKEIEYRQKQYEYYREHLLTFKGKQA